MKKIFLCAAFLLMLAVPNVRGQAPADSIGGSKVYLVNQLMRDVIIPANSPEDPDVIPVGYRAEMLGEGETRVAQRGEHFWLFTTELVDSNGLYEKWVAAGRPEPVADFARDQIAEEEFTLAADTAAAAPAPPEPAPAETTVAASAEASASSGGWSWLWIGALVLLVLLVLAYFWQRRGQRERVA